MTTAGSPARGAAIRVRVYKRGHLVESRLFETEADANALIAHWCDVDDVEFELDDLSSQHRAGDILDPTPSPADTMEETAARD
jgi:hypothetical protein